MAGVMFFRHKLFKGLSMSNRNQQMQRLIRQYREETGKKEIDMKDVAAWAHSRGWPLPKPLDPIERLAHDFARAARDETRQDMRTGRPYRVYHAVPYQRPDGQQFSFWVDIDEAPRAHMQTSLQLRRRQMVGDGYQLTLDAEHWNSRNQKEEPIVIDLDFTQDIAEKKHEPDDDVG